jgi:SAM-dependent methyltransferase
MTTPPRRRRETTREFPPRPPGRMMNSEGSSALEYGSFRDPSGSVFYRGGEVYRAIDSATHALMAQIESSGLLKELVSSSLIIGTRVLNDSATCEELRKIVPEGECFLRHERVPVVSYPYEWTSSMIADAAILQLRLQAELLGKGYALKDASAYNVQFVGSKPVFIDVPSIEKPARLDIWIAYGQFCRMFLFPLILRKLRSYSTKAYYATNIDGMDVEEVYAVLGMGGALRPCAFTDVFLQKALRGHSVSRGQRVEKDLVKSTKQSDPAVQVLNLKRIMKSVRRLGRPSRKSGHWVDYASDNSYSASAEKAKAEFTRSFLEEHRPQTVLDLGCNTGTYSMLAADAGSRVVAVDSDHECINALYSSLREHPRDILPLWIDLCNPSPGLGYRNKERRPFLERTRSDCVFAFALVHHLLVTSRIPLHEIRDLMFSLTNKWLLIEFVAVADDMFQQLLSLRENIYGEFTQESFEQAFDVSFRLADKTDLAGTRRSLYAFEKKTI